jgi:hypothetical protein
MYTNGVVGRFRTYKGYELRQRPVPSPNYGLGGSFANLLTTTIIFYIIFISNARKIVLNFEF